MPLLSQGRQKCPQTPRFLVLVLPWCWSGSAPVVSSMLVVVLGAQTASGPPVVPHGLGTQQSQRCPGVSLGQGAGHGVLPARCSSSPTPSHHQQRQLPPGAHGPSTPWTRASSPQPLLFPPL